MAEKTDEEIKQEKEEKEKAEKEKASELTAEEVTKLIEKARKQEKDKLYPEITELKGQVKDLLALAEKSEDEKERIKKEAEKQAEKERQKGQSAEERLADQLSRFEERLAEERAERDRLSAEVKEERERLNTELSEERTQRKLDEYKAQLLRDAGDEIIEELVTGTTVEELDKSKALAEAKYKELFDAALEKAKGERGGPGGKGSAPDAPRPTNPDMTTEEEKELQTNLSNLDIDHDRMFGNRLKGIKKDDAYAQKVRDQMKEIENQVARAYQRQ